MPRRPGQGRAIALHGLLVKRGLRFARRAGMASTMENDVSKSREERLAAKLRENLRRRKAQARALESRAGGKDMAGVQSGGTEPEACENESGRLSKSAPES
jgi:hypothetical protein